MIVIESIGSYIPANFESNLYKKDKFGVTDDFIKNKIGVEKVSRKLPGEETSDLCVKALENLKGKTVEDLSRVDCLIVCTQNPDGGGIPHTSAEIHGKIDHPHECACFDISLGCSGYVYGLSIAKSFMESNNMRTGLFFTADPYSKIIDPDDKNTMLLFGDAATVTLLKNIDSDHSGWTPQKFCFATKGKAGNALNNRGKHLFMNGRAIFNFSMMNVPQQIKKLLDASGLDYQDIDLFLLHQGSKFVVDQLCRSMKLPSVKVPVNLAQFGNTVCSSIPLLLQDYLLSDRFERIVLSGFGVGLSWASCLLTIDRDLDEEKQ